MHSFFFFFLFSLVQSSRRIEFQISNILSCRLQICLQFAGLNNASYVYIYNIFALFFINSLLHETIKPFFPRYVLCLDFHRVFAHLLRLYEFHVKIPFFLCYFSSLIEKRYRIIPTCTVHAIDGCKCRTTKNFARM